ncbi:zinc-ribbon domain-containing protein [Bacillus sp. C11]|nr:zinc-ribbon domain-containing protein [Neobacillus terrae]
MLNIFVPGSGAKAWWQCPNNAAHEWKVQVFNRKAGNNCPICAGKVVHESNSLATLYLEIAKQWHPKKLER